MFCWSFIFYLGRACVHYWDEHVVYEVWSRFYNSGNNGPISPPGPPHVDPVHEPSCFYGYWRAYHKHRKELSLLLQYNNSQLQIIQQIKILVLKKKFTLLKNCVWWRQLLTDSVLQIVNFEALLLKNQSKKLTQVLNILW